MGVALPEGAHTITLRYRPAGLELGLGISLAGALFLLGAWRLNRQRVAARARPGTRNLAD